MDFLDLSLPSVSPSLLAKKGGDLVKEAKLCEEAGISLLHFDYMRPPFVEGTGLSKEDFLAIHRKTSCLEDVHLMTDEVEEDGLFFLNAGADILTFHGTISDPGQLLNLYRFIRYRGKRAGIAISPDASISSITPFLDLVDLVLIMGVIPGACGKSSDPRGEEHLKEVFQLREERRKNHKSDFLISFDGGVNAQNGRHLREEGVDILVSGSFFFQGDREENRKALLS